MRINAFLKKSVLLSAITVFTAFGLAGCGDTDAGKTSSNPTSGSEVSSDGSNDNVDTSNLKPFRVGCGDATINRLNDLAAVAQNDGYLEEELNKVGYTLQVTGFQGQGPEINAALMSGSLDAGNYAEFPAFTSKASGADTTIAAVSDTQLLYGILAASDDIQSIEDLEGKSIIVQQGTALQYIWDQVVAETGIDGDKVEIINANVSDGASLLQTGDADALLSSQYILKNYENSGVGHMIEGAVPDSVYSLTVFNFSNAILEEAPEVAVAVNKALIRAYNTVMDDAQAFYDLLGEKYGDKGAELIEATYTIDSSLEYLYPEFDDELSSHMKEVYEWMNNNSLLAGEVDVDTYIDSTYFQQALEELE